MGGSGRGNDLNEKEQRVEMKAFESNLRRGMRARDHERTAPMRCGMVRCTWRHAIGRLAGVLHVSRVS